MNMDFNAARWSKLQDQLFIGIVQVTAEFFGNLKGISHADLLRQQKRRLPHPFTKMGEKLDNEL